MELPLEQDGKNPQGILIRLLPQQHITLTIEDYADSHAPNLLFVIATTSVGELANRDRGVWRCVESLASRVTLQIALRAQVYYGDGLYRTTGWGALDSLSASTSSDLVAPPGGPGTVDREGAAHVQVTAILQVLYSTCSRPFRSTWKTDSRGPWDARQW
jgi:hypothetical protein